MATKFPKIPNKRSFEKDAAYNRYAGMWQASAFAMRHRINNGTFKVVATEKLDGEQFRIGIDEKGVYIGQRNNCRYVEGDDPTPFHSNGGKFNDDLKDTLQGLTKSLRRWKDYNMIPCLFGTDSPDPIPDMFLRTRFHPTGRSVSNRHFDAIFNFDELVYGNTMGIAETFPFNTSEIDPFTITDITLFGELVGDSMQRRFKWSHGGLDVYWYDMQFTVKINEEYDLETLPEYIKANFLPHKDEDGRELTYTVYCGFEYLRNMAGRLGIEGKLVKPIRKLWIEEDGILDYLYTLPEAYNIDVDTLPPLTPLYATKGNTDPSEENKGVCEGIVLSHALPTVFPFRLKLKSQKFVEVHDATRNKGVSKKWSDSPFAKFVTEERVHHAIEHIKEVGEVDPEVWLDIRRFKDAIAHITRRVAVDIAEEENGGVELPDDDRRAVSKLTVNEYRRMCLA